MAGLRARIKFYFRKLLLRLQSEDQKALILAANQLLKQTLADSTPKALHQLEFRVFSQFGEDGIIQFLINNVEIPNKTFVEFGVEDYTESNTRFLLVNNNWRGLVMDGSSLNIEFIQRDPIYWRHNLTAVCSFITKDNINDSIRNAGFEGDIGLLSIDIDGNDYWVWDAITAISPRIVVIEYNSVLGSSLKLTVPYDPAFVRGKAHYSHLYFGASLAALCDLGSRKGYYFVGCNANGNNAFFIRNDLKTSLPRKTTQEGYVESQFREARDQEGRLTFASGGDRLLKIKDQEFIDLHSNKRVLLREVM